MIENKNAAIPKIFIKNSNRHNEYFVISLKSIFSYYTPFPAKQKAPRQTRGH